MLRSRMLVCRLASLKASCSILAPTTQFTSVRNWGDDRSFKGDSGFQRGGGGFNRGEGGFGGGRGGGFGGGRGGFGGGRGGGFRDRQEGGFGGKQRYDNNVITRDADFSKLEPLKKDFYKENPSVAERNGEDIQTWLKKHNVTLDGKSIPRPVFKFDEVGFPEEISKLLSGMYQEPTPIQSISWPAALSGRDLISIAQTGSGKTLGFMLPAIVHSLNQPAHGDPHIVVLTPTRELCQQVSMVTKEITKPLGIRMATVYGGAQRDQQLRELRVGPQIVVGTPGRLTDFINAGIVDVTKTSYVVLDEADRMLDMGFEPQIRQILRMIRPDRQTLMFSATWPEDVRALAQKFQKDPVFLNVGSLELSANPNINQIIEVIEEHEKSRKVIELIHDIRKDPKSKMLIFTQTKRTADNLMFALRKNGLSSALCIHGDKKQGERDFAMGEFRKAACRMLVATDVAARGIDVADITHVINYDMPNTIEDYVHRIGRTARAGRRGTAISFFTTSNVGLANGLIEQLRECQQNIPPELERFGTGRGRQQFARGGSRGYSGEY